MATRYEVRWCELPATWKRRGFAFRFNALRFFSDLCERERSGERLGGLVLEHLGPDGERGAYPFAESVPAEAGAGPDPIGGGSGVVVASTVVNGLGRRVCRCWRCVMLGHAGRGGS